MVDAVIRDTLLPGTLVLIAALISNGKAKKCYLDIKCLALKRFHSN
jgi:hypothetical protein